MALPDDGDHVVPGMLAPLVVRDGIGRHVEPNVWVVHRSRSAWWDVARRRGAMVVPRLGRRERSYRGHTDATKDNASRRPARPGDSAVVPPGTPSSGVPRA